MSDYHRHDDKAGDKPSIPSRSSSSTSSAGASLAKQASTGKKRRPLPIMPPSRTGGNPSPAPPLPDVPLVMAIRPLSRDYEGELQYQRRTSGYPTSVHSLRDEEYPSSPFSSHLFHNPVVEQPESKSSTGRPEFNTNPFESSSIASPAPANESTKLPSNEAEYFDFNLTRPLNLQLNEPGQAVTRTRAPLETGGSTTRRSSLHRRTDSMYSVRDIQYTSLLGQPPSGEKADHRKEIRQTGRLDQGVPQLEELDMSDLVSQLWDKRARPESMMLSKLDRRDSDTDDLSPISLPPHYTRDSKPPFSTIAEEKDESDVVSYAEKILSHNQPFLDHYDKRMQNISEEKNTNWGWTTEYIGTPVTSRPSIVSLPPYPSPSGTLSNSWGYTLKHTCGRYLLMLTCVLTNLAGTMYFRRRYHDILIVQIRYPGLYFSGWLFLFIESIMSLVIGTHILCKTVAFFLKHEDDKLRARGDKFLPMVDIFVVSSGQADQTVFDCAAVAASVDYPGHRFRVMVLDPAGSDTLQKEIIRHAKTQGCPQLTYHRRQLSRSKGDVHHSKANSINFGMKEATVMGIKGPGDFIVVLDADMLIERNFIRATLPPFLMDDDVAMVKTRNGYINLPRLLHQFMAVLMLAVEAPISGRSGFVLRRSAIEEIGGFPTESWIQDGLCESLLRGRGYKTRDIDEILEWGYAKPTFGDQVNQMMINSMSGIRTGMRLGMYLTSSKLQMMSVRRRILGIFKVFTPLYAFIIFLFTIAYPVMFIRGGVIIFTPNSSTLNELLQLVLFVQFSNMLHESIWRWATGVVSPRLELQAWVFAAPYKLWAFMRVFLPWHLGGYRRGSDIDLNVIVTVPTAPSWGTRISWWIRDPHTPILFLYLTSLGIAIRLAVEGYASNALDVHQTLLRLLLGVLWPTLGWFEFFQAVLVPTVCILFPTRRLTEPRENFLVRDTHSSVARPKHLSKTSYPFKLHKALPITLGIMILGWALATVLVGKFTTLFK